MLAIMPAPRKKQDTTRSCPGGPADYYPSETLSYLKKLHKYFADRVRVEKRAGVCDEIVRAGTDFVKKLREVKERARKQKTVIGVLGTTGSGKSSLINALIDEEALLPTAGHCACTAAPTEVSFNADRKYAYRAEITFVSKKDWEDELSILIGSAGVSGEGEDEATEKDKVAVKELEAKLKAIMGFDIKASSIDKSFRLPPKVSKLLGTKLKFADNDVKKFRAKIIPYVASLHDNATATHDFDGEKLREGGRRNGVWPLVKSIKLFTRAPILESGVTIVDLPGTQDANRARAAIAEEYMKNCNAIWVVALIKRAVDNKHARELLGRSFRRQLMMEGGYGSVSFICTCADEFVSSECEHLPGVAEAMQRMKDARESLSNEVEELENQIKKIRRDSKELDRDIRANERKTRNFLRKEEVSRGSTTESVLGRSGFVAATKFLRLGSQQSQNSQLIATISLAEFTSLQGILDKQRRESKALKRRLRALRRKLQPLKKKLRAAKRESEADSVKCRNDICKEQIRNAFAEGLADIVEGDSDNLAEDPASSNAAGDTLTLSIMTRAYQNLSGREIGGNTGTFAKKSQTEIPALQRHCAMLTSTQKDRVNAGFARHFARLLHSIQAQAAPPITILSGLSKPEVTRLKRDVDNFLVDMHENLARVYTATVTQMNTSVKSNLAGHFDPAIAKAISESEKVIQMFDKKNVNPNLKWNTIRAICAKGGKHTINADGETTHIDLNEMLVTPMLDILAARWRGLFELSFPEATKVLETSLRQVFQHSSSDLAARFHSVNADKQKIEQITAWLQPLEEGRLSIKQDLLEDIAARQRELGGCFKMSVALCMDDIYKTGAETKGKGTGAVLRRLMTDGIREKREVIFTAAAKKAIRDLEAMINEITNTLHANLKEGMEQLRTNFAKMEVASGRMKRPDPRLERVQEEVDEMISRAQLPDYTEYLMNAEKEFSQEMPSDDELSSNSDSEISDDSESDSDSEY